MSKICENVHQLELRKSIKFCVDMETYQVYRKPLYELLHYFLFSHASPILFSSLDFF